MALYYEILCLYIVYKVNGISLDSNETVVLCVCVTMSQEDMIFSHVYLYVCVVSLITNYFGKFKPICLLKPLRKRRLSYFQSGGQKCATKTCK